jgi:hypothetical protein
MEPEHIYHYGALEHLETNPFEIEQQIKEDVYNVEIHLVVYEVNQESQYQPFLRFLLDKDFKHELQFIKINPILLLMNKKPFFEYLNDYLFLALSVNNGKSSNLNYECKGMYRAESGIYLFIDISKTKLEIVDVYQSNPLWFTLVDEIMNQKHVCGINVNSNVTDFFSIYPHFLFIQDEKRKPIEIPIVAYVGRSEKKLEFTYVFGVSKTDELLGENYYFTDFENACKQIQYQNLKEKIGIVRFAIFTGNLMIKDNLLSSDEGWSDSYDSIYLKMDEIPIYVLNKWEQQQSLSFHFIHFLEKNGGKTSGFNII